MKYKFIIIAIVTLYFTSEKCFSQSFDSTHIYALSMSAMYRVNIGKDLIKNETNSIVITENDELNSLYSLLVDSVKRGMPKKIKNNYCDIRLYFEFFKNGLIVKEIGFTPQSAMFINHNLYTYDKHQLKRLDKYVVGLSEILGVK